MLNLCVRALRCLLLMALLVAGPAAAQGPVYSLAVQPSAPPVAMHSAWSPYVERIEREAGIRLKLKHYDKMAEFERDIWNGVPDFLFSSPIQLVVGHQSNGYVPLVRAARPVTVGLFVRKDSPIRSVSDLAGKKISFVGNKALCSVAMQHLLARNNDKLSFEKEYAGSTRNVILNILLGKTDAGSIFLSDMDSVAGDTRARLRELVVSDEIASHPLSAHPRVPRAAQEAVRRATLRLAGELGGVALLTTIRLENPVAADYARDYAALEEIDIRRLTLWGE
jgi:phosphonate transport system substrate-binding protein